MFKKARSTSKKSETIQIEKRGLYIKKKKGGSTFKSQAYMKKRLGLCFKKASSM